jgi:hypothetical protein
MLNARALSLAAALGTVLQIAMVLIGHSHPAVAGLYAVGGMGFSLLAGLAYAFWAPGGSASAAAVGGLAAGALCALIGILVSYLLGDVPASLLALGTISSAVTGAFGGWAGRMLFRAGVAAALLAITAGAAPRADAQAAVPVAVSVANASSAVTTTTDAFRWLVGRWEGRMAGMAGIADVTFAAPAGGVITGMMRLVRDDKVLVVELISLVDTPAGVEMRFRHFSPSLESYEPTFRQNMRLTRHAADRAVFENAVAYDKALMSTQPRTTTWTRTGDDTFVGHSDIIGDDGKAGVVEVTYRRVR